MFFHSLLCLILSQTTSKNLLSKTYPDLKGSLSQHSIYGGAPSDSARRRTADGIEKRVKHVHGGTNIHHFRKRDDDTANRIFHPEKSKNSLKAIFTLQLEHLICRNENKSLFLPPNFPY